MLVQISQYHVVSYIEFRVYLTYIFTVIVVQKCCNARCKALWKKKRGLCRDVYYAWGWGFLWQRVWDQYTHEWFLMYDLLLEKKQTLKVLLGWLEDFLRLEKSKKIFIFFSLLNYSTIIKQWWSGSPKDIRTHPM